MSSWVDVFGGVDTHRDVHVAAVVDGAGRVLGSESFAADSTGYRELVAWMGSAGRLVGWGWKEPVVTVPGWLAIWLRPTSRWWRSTVLTGSYAARGAASPTASTPRGQLGQLPQARLRLFPNPVTAPLSA